MLSVDAITFDDLSIDSLPCSNAHMELRDVRLKNFRGLLGGRFSGNVAALARAIGRQPAQVRVYLNPEKAGGRWLGEKMARDIESKLGLDPLALDREDGAGRGVGGKVEGTTGAAQPPTIGDLVRLVSPSVNPHTERLIERLLQLDRAGALPSELSDSLVNLLQACLMTSNRAVKAGDYSKLMDAFNDRKPAK